MAEAEEELQGEDAGNTKKVLKRSRRKKENRREEEPQVLEEEKHSDCVLLRGIFKLGKKSHDVLLTRTRLTWTPIIPETPTGSIIPTVSHMAWSPWDWTATWVIEGMMGNVPPSGTNEHTCDLKYALTVCERCDSDVFAVKVKRRRVVGQQTGGAFLGLALFYCRRRGKKLEEDMLHLHNSSSEHTHRWYSTLKEQLQEFSSRPRYLKVFINPCSHKKEAVYIYREHVAPLFKIADIRTDITVTERKGHALSVMKECKLDEYDGVVCVGGDGSVAEICHAIVLRAQLDADSPEKPVKPVLPLGIIPAGSTDVVSCSVHGLRDPTTAAMHIVLGHLQQVDMCSFSSFGQLVRFGFSAMFGFGAQSLARAEKKRWMPSSRRREYALVKTLARLRPEDCQISFLPVNKSKRNFSEQEDQDQHQNPDSVDAVGEESWTTIRGLYLSISVMSIPCLSSVIPHGLAPNTRLANGSASLIAVGNTSRSEFVKHLKRYSSSSGQVVHTLTYILLASILMKARQLSVKLQGVIVQRPVLVPSHVTKQEFNFSFVETHDISAVKIQLHSVAGWLEEESEEEESKTSPIIQSERATFLWNIDGELVEMANEVLIRVHPCLITLYGEEVDEAESAASCSCI